MKHQDITDKIIKAFYKVYNTLGYGFLEKVYQNALYIELVHQQLVVEKQKRIQVVYLDHAVGDYFADLMVNNLIIIELKAHECFLEEHNAS